MRNFGQDEMTDRMGLGYLGEIRRGPDGELYQWVQGVDNLGNLTGWWSKIKSGVKRAVKTASQLVQKPYCIPLKAIPGPVKGIAKKVCRVVGKLSPLAHVPVVGSYYKGAAKLCKIAKDCGIAGIEGGLMQAPDGSYYQVQGLGENVELYGPAEDEVLYGLGEEDLNEIMGIGSLGEIRIGPDGEQYQWVEGMDGLGRRVRHWRCKACIRASKMLARRRRRKNLSARQSGPGRPTPSVTPPNQPGAATIKGLGNLYQDDSVDEMGYFAQEEDLYGLAEDEELFGADGEEDLMGYGEEDDLEGYGEDDDLEGYGEDDAADDLEGYITDDRVQGLDAFVKDEPPGLRKFQAGTPATWQSLW